MLVGFPNLEHATYSCPCEQHGSVLSCPSRNISQKGRNRVRRSNKVYKHRGFRHTCDCQGWQHCLVIPLAKHFTERRERLGRWKNVLSVDRERKKDRQRLDRLYVIICINAMQLQVQFISHFHPSHQVSIFTHTHSIHFSAFSLHNTPCTSHP